MGIGSKSHIVYLSDFHLSKKYWENSSKTHIPFINDKKIVGNAKYLSINALSGNEQSRRDDLESIGYMIVHFIKGTLPWQGLKIKNKDEKFKKVCELKKQITTKNLCKDLPDEFESFLQYAINLEFTEVPNYNYLRNLLKNVMKKSGFDMDFHYDWLNEKPNIPSDDPIFTNDYKIVYDGQKEWLSNLKNEKTEK